MNIIIRDYKAGDSSQIVEVFRDSMNTLRKSKGGTHPDDAVDKAVNEPDDELQKMLEWGSAIIVAEVQETGEIAGMGAITTKWYNRLLRSTMSRAHFVKEKFQRGRAGVSVGKMLRIASIQKAKGLGFRKIFGYSTPEAVGFHKKFGAVFYPEHNGFYLDKRVVTQYYEIELRKSALNRMRPEAYISGASHLTGRLFASIRPSNR